MSTASFKKLIEIKGTQVKVSVELGISEAAVSQWGGVIPLKRAVAIERMTEGAITAGDIVNDYHQARG